MQAGTFLSVTTEFGGRAVQYLSINSKECCSQIKKAVHLIEDSNMPPWRVSLEKRVVKTLICQYVHVTALSYEFLIITYNISLISVGGSGIRPPGRLPVKIFQACPTEETCNSLSRETSLSCTF